MNKVEKLTSLKIYVNDLNTRLTSPIPDKHKSHPETFKAYIALEINKATRTIEKLKLETGSN